MEQIWKLNSSMHFTLGNSRNCDSNKRVDVAGIHCRERGMLTIRIENHFLHLASPCPTLEYLTCFL